MYEDGIRNDKVHFCIVVAQDYLLQVDKASSHIGRRVLSINYIRDTLFSCPIISFEHDLSNPFDINTEKSGSCFIILMAEISHTNSHNPLFFVCHMFCYSFFTQRRRLPEISFIECDHFSTDIAYSKVQCSYMWLKISTICWSLFISFNNNTVPIRKSNHVTLWYGIKSSEVYKVSILYSIKVFMKNIRFLHHTFILNPNWLSGSRDYKEKQADNELIWVHY